jgi:ribosomal protein S8
MTNDLVSDMLTRIRNASLARHSFTRIRYSKLNLAILKVLEAEGYQQGTAIISTSSGIMSHLKATKLKKGGEILCYIG